MTPQGPRLIEMGARLQGLLSLVPALNVECIGYDPLTLTVDAYTNPDAFALKTAQPYILKKYAYGVYLTTSATGASRASPVRSGCETFPPFLTCCFVPSPVRTFARPSTILRWSASSC